MGKGKFNTGVTFVCTAQHTMALRIKYNQFDYSATTMCSLSHWCIHSMIILLGRSIHDGFIIDELMMPSTNIRSQLPSKYLLPLFQYKLCLTTEGEANILHALVASIVGSNSFDTVSDEMYSDETLSSDAIQIPSPVAAFGVQSIHHSLTRESRNVRTRWGY